DVQNWLSSPGSNFGWIVIGDESGTGTAKRFDSRENSTASNQPALTIDYTTGGNTAPTITSANSTAFTVGTAGTFTVTASGTPTPSISETGTLPGGVSFNTTTGVLSGTPAAGTSGTYPLTFTASNGVGSNATQSFTLTVNQAPAVTSGTSTTFTVG